MTPTPFVLKHSFLFLMACSTIVLAKKTKAHTSACNSLLVRKNDGIPWKAGSSFHSVSKVPVYYISVYIHQQI
ncbi:hypothetical protein BDA96_06G093700 [Sorghum bicolor]|uniref:Secreted protein n=1 Tax=Sorghum bicolor TaxID=4558 RepID=A0A921QPY4_SORBI|nr:hypothetical protein BDA96_06G093700 [Sorghum bicolor]